MCWVMLISKDRLHQVGCAGTVVGEQDLWAAQAAHRDICVWETLGRQHIPLSLPPVTAGLFCDSDLLASKDWDLQCGTQAFSLN